MHFNICATELHFSHVHLKEGLFRCLRATFFGGVRLNINFLIRDVCYSYLVLIFFCQMRRMTQLLKAIYGEKMYKSKNHPDWVKLVEKPSYPVVAAQGANECRIYVLRLTQLYDGQRLVEKIIKFDVTPSLFSSLSCYFFLLFYLFTFCSL